MRNFTVLTKRGSHKSKFNVYIRIWHHHIFRWPLTRVERTRTLRLTLQNTHTIREKTSKREKSRRGHKKMNKTVICLVFPLAYQLFVSTLNFCKQCILPIWHVTLGRRFNLATIMWQWMLWCGVRNRIWVWVFEISMRVNVTVKVKVRFRTNNWTEIDRIMHEL